MPAADTSADTWAEFVEQTVDRLKRKRYLPHEPTSKQWRFLKAPEREVGYGGAAGGGKTDALLMAALLFVEWPAYSAILLRTTFRELKQPDSLIPRSQAWLSGTDAEYHRGDKAWTFPSGATLRFGYLESDGDEQQYQSAQFHFIGFDEATHFTGDQYRYLFSRLRRRADESIPLRMRSGTNPTGPGLSWYRERFIESDDEDRRFIPARLEDNPHLDTEEYERQLQRLPPALAEKLRYGANWEELGGGTMFDRDAVELVDETPGVRSRVRFWDFAATEPSATNRDPDYCCGVRLARGSDGSWGVEHVRRDRRGPDGVEDMIVETARADGREVPIVLEIEGGSQAKVAVQYIATQVLTGFDVYTQRVSRGKEERAGPLASQWQRGQVWVKRGAWTHDYLDEMHDFPSAPHDDQVDASTGAFNWMTRRTASRRDTGGEPEVSYQPSPL